MSEITAEIQSAFIKEAIWYGQINQAEALLAAHLELAVNSIHTAAILADHETVKAFIERDALSVHSVAEPFGGTALNYLCMSKYLSYKKRPVADFIKTAEILMDAGADPNSGFHDPVYNDTETCLYGAAGVAQNAELTSLLLQRGADPNDNEACYHSPETYDNGAMEAIVKTGKLTLDNLVMMLIRKHDYHDFDGAKFLLEHGADPNVGWGPKSAYPIHHALARGNQLEIIELLFNHGADVTVKDNGHTAVARAAREGRGDVLGLMRKRGIELNLTGADELIAACAEDDSAKISEIVATAPAIGDEVKAIGGRLLARFAGSGNAKGIKNLLNLGIDVNTPYLEGDPYFGTPGGSLPIHVAAWKGYPAIVELLIERGSIIDQSDTNGETPLMLAVKACVNSYWMYRRSPDSVKALLLAGADVNKVTYPSGWQPVDDLLKQYRA